MEQFLELPKEKILITQVHLGKVGFKTRAYRLQIKMKERSQQKPPQIIGELNANLGASEITVESIAEKVGISKAALYRWVKQDSEFADALKIIKEVQEDDPFKTGDIEDVQVKQMVITLLLLETRDQHFKPGNI